MTAPTLPTTFRHPRRLLWCLMPALQPCRTTQWTVGVTSVLGKCACVREEGGREEGKEGGRRGEEERKRGREIDNLKNGGKGRIDEERDRGM